jgi:uncharacterized protein (DUF2062 family)
MTDNEHDELLQTKYRRTRRVKRWLRHLPRRSNIHRYPILSLFADAARKRIYLWSFRTENAIPAIYAGCILTLLPAYGIQLPIALLLAILLRANLPILAGLQIVSNPITVLPIWYAAYQIGRHFLSVLGVEALPLRREEVRIMLDNFISGQWGNNLERVMTAFGVTSLGSIIMGIFFGLIVSVAYRIVANRTAASYALLREKIRLHKARKTTQPFEKDPDA